MPYHTIPTLFPQTPSRDTRHSNRAQPYAASNGWGYSKLFGGAA